MPLSVDPSKLRQARIKAGLRKEQVAVHAGLSYPTITAYEAGTIKPRASKLLALAQLYRVPVEDLCSDVEEVGA